jgi:hypothetical protein
LRRLPQAGREAGQGALSGFSWDFERLSHNA